jgi:hypothetical protein
MMRLYTCKEVTQLVLERQVRALSWRERLGVRLHLLICDACTRFERQMQFIRTALRRYTQRHDIAAQDMALTPASKDRIRRRLRDTQPTQPGEHE